MKQSLVNELIKTLEDRFAKNIHRHTGIDWNTVQGKLLSSPEKLRTLYEMELTGGEPDVISYDEKTGEITFCDCSPESPTGRRSICYDRKALDSRKENKPGGNAIEMASAIGIELLGISVVRSFVIAAITMCSSITMALNHTMPREAFAVDLAFNC
ncbi:MAG: hypothetical protein JWQ09_2204 [Segetibacter sp.]|nr:hypothetical protein [Segetibacter sp.]